MNKFFIGMVLALVSINASHAQVVGSIGIGEVSYATPKHNSSLGNKTYILGALNTQIEEALRNTRKFKVMNNAQLTNFLDQRLLTLDSFDNHVSHTDVLLQSGLDYVLNADIVSLDVYTQKRGNQNASTGLIEINLFMQGVSHSTEDFRQKVTTQVPLQGSQELSTASQQIINAGVEQLVDQIVTKLFPVRIIQIYEDERIKLNYGDNLLSVGDTIHLYEESRIGEVFDTLREPLNRTDEVILQVIAVDKRFSIAKALGGFDKVKNRMVGKLQLNEF